MAFSLTNTIASPFQQNLTKIRPSALISNKPRCVTCSYSEGGKDFNRRNVLIGLGSVFGIAASAKAANAGYAQSDEPPLEPVYEFGPEPRPLDKVIRCLVDVPKEKKDVTIVRIDDIVVPNNDAVRFDVYLAKPVGNKVEKDYGEYIGSDVDLAHQRNKNIKGRVELGITHFLEDLEAEDSDKMVVTLVPRTNKVIIGGVSIYTTEAS